MKVRKEGEIDVEKLFFENMSSESGYLYWSFVALFVILAFYIAFPFIFRFSATLQRHCVFMHLLSLTGFKRRYYEPETHGLEGGRNFYLTSTTESDVTIGLWHILPKSFISVSKGKPASFWEETLRTSSNPVIIYFHGNMGTRASGHRQELYKLLQELEYHVIPFDYRGYADSSPVKKITESGAVADGRAVYNWVCKTLGNNNSESRIMFWGHSLGTGVSTHLLSDLSLEGTNSVKGLILESPFNNMKEELKSIYLTRYIYKFWPCFDWCFTSKLIENDMAFQSDWHIRNIEHPIIILHVINDIVVPYRLGKELSRVASKYRPKSAKPSTFVKLVGYTFHDAHVFICRDPKLPSLVTDFVHSCIKED